MDFPNAGTRGAIRCARFRRFDCVAPEMRGYGETDAPVGVANYSLDKLVGDVADLIEAFGRSARSSLATTGAAPLHGRPRLCGPTWSIASSS